MPTARRKLKARVLLAAASGAAVVSLAGCPITSGNLIATPECGEDAGPPGCIVPECYLPDGGPKGCIPVKLPDGGSDGGLGGDQ